MELSETCAIMHNAADNCSDDVGFASYDNPLHGRFPDDVYDNANAEPLSPPSPPAYHDQYLDPSQLPTAVVVGCSEIVPNFAPTYSTIGPTTFSDLQTISGGATDDGGGGIDLGDPSSFGEPAIAYLAVDHISVGDPTGPVLAPNVGPATTTAASSGRAAADGERSRRQHRRHDAQRDGERQQLKRRRKVRTIDVEFERKNVESWVADVVFWPWLFVLNLPCFIVAVILTDRAKSLILAGKLSEGHRHRYAAYGVGLAGIVFSLLVVLVVALSLGAATG